MLELLPWIPHPINATIHLGWLTVVREAQYLQICCICDQCGLLYLQVVLSAFWGSQYGRGLIRLKSWIGLGVPMLWGRSIHTSAHWENELLHFMHSAKWCFLWELVEWNCGFLKIVIMPNQIDRIVFSAALGKYDVDTEWNDFTWSIFVVLNGR